MIDSPLCIDLFCGLGGWADGFLAEGFRVVGFDIERHDYGTGGYPGQLVLQDVATLHGSQFKEAAVIVASPPCQAYSYRAMPWKRARALPPPSNELFEACFRIQREASEAAGRYIPLVVENVCGSQKWVGRARWHFGSFYLWGDVPALMPLAREIRNGSLGGGSWFGVSATNTMLGMNPDGRKIAHASNDPARCTSKAMGFNVAAAQRYREGRKQEGSGPIWFDTGIAKHSSSSDSRKAASAAIAKIPLPLAQHVAKVYKP